MMGGMMSGMMSSQNVSTNLTVVDQNVAAFKETQPLLDDAGNPIQEPDERVLHSIRSYRTCVMCVFYIFNTVFTLAVVAYVLFRVYVWSCYKQFRWMTMAKLNGASFPISAVSLHKIVKACNEAVRGTGQAEGVPCRPDFEEVLQVCTNEPAGQRPKAMGHFFYNWFGLQKWGIHCFHGVCELRDKIVPYDKIVAVVFLGLLVALCVCRHAANASIAKYKRREQMKTATHIREVMAKNRGSTRPTSSWR